MNNYEHTSFSGQTWKSGSLEITARYDHLSDYSAGTDNYADSTIHVEISSEAGGGAFHLMNPSEMLEVAQILSRISADLMQAANPFSRGDAGAES